MRTTLELLGARIREIRKASKLSQEQLAEKVNVDFRHISRLELGNNSPPIETLERIAQALNVEIKELFDFEQLSSEPVSIQDIETLLADVTDEEMRQQILRITKAVTRAVKLKV